MSLKIEMMVTLMMGTVVQLLVQWKMGISAMVVITLIQTPAPLLLVVIATKLVMKHVMMRILLIMMAVHLLVKWTIDMIEQRAQVHLIHQYELRHVVMDLTHIHLSHETMVILTIMMAEQIHAL